MVFVGRRIGRATRDVVGMPGPCVMTPENARMARLKPEQVALADCAVRRSPSEPAPDAHGGTGKSWGAAVRASVLRVWPKPKMEEAAASAERSKKHVRAQTNANGECGV